MGSATATESGKLATCFDHSTEGAGPLTVTIAVEMAKFKPVKPKAKSTPAPRGGMACVVLVFIGLVLVGFFLYFVMKYAAG